jgi:hypothetical protein
MHEPSAVRAAEYVVAVLSHSSPALPAQPHPSSFPFQSAAPEVSPEATSESKQQEVNTHLPSSVSAAEYVCAVASHVSPPLVAASTHPQSMFASVYTPLEVSPEAMAAFAQQVPASSHLPPSAGPEMAVLSHVWP